ncbi:hypothetical protein K788_0000872 [Paraburkholderia caribensis MBA4]|uniref:Uncharacterized protein n=1 Tax=Paraburkholderia caribensis MBA4 TaxID=1323664 RepID=A0A0P0RH13_9BURK|nr:hypothetical protein K788_0000872 [Paraburkholderia caribensis MBA4]
MSLQCLVVLRGRARRGAAAGARQCRFRAMPVSRASAARAAKRAARRFERWYKFVSKWRRIAVCRIRFGEAYLNQRGRCRSRT